MQTGTNKLALSVTETAKALGVSRPTVYALLRREDFPVVCIGSRKLVPVEGLKNWLTKNTEVTK